MGADQIGFFASGQFAVIVLATKGAVGARAALEYAYHASHLWIRLALWSLVIVDGIQSRLLTVWSGSAVVL